MNSSNAKTIAVVVIIAALGFFLYRTVSKSDTDTLTVETTTDTAAVGADIAILLDQINNLQIDSAIFQSPVYQSLNDYTNEVPALPQGKKNPFSPFSGFVAPAPTKAQKTTKR